MFNLRRFKPDFSNGTELYGRRMNVNSDVSMQVRSAVAQPISVRATMVAVVCWQVAFTLLAYVYSYTISPVVELAYSSGFGDVQIGMSTFSRFATYFGLLTVTLFASSITLLVVQILVRRRVAMKRTAVVLIVWEVVVMAILTLSYEIDFPYLLHEMIWRLFGQTDDLYSFQNLVLHRIIAWLLCTAPPSWFAVKAYSRSLTAFSSTIP